MRITFDQAKRALTLEKRGLDFALAGLVFGERHMTRIDDRRDLASRVSYRSEGWVAMLWFWLGRRAAHHINEEGKWP